MNSWFAAFQSLQSFQSLWSFCPSPNKVFGALGFDALLVVVSGHKMGRQIGNFFGPTAMFGGPISIGYAPRTVRSAGRLTEVTPMPLAVNSIILLAQGNAPEGGGLFGGALGPLIPFLVIGMLFYLLLIRPERQKRKEMDKMLESLNKDDQIITAGGIWGVVVNSSKGSEFITIRVDEGSGAKLRVLRSAVTRVITDGNTPGTKDGST